MPRQPPDYRPPRDWLDTNHDELRDFGKKRHLTWRPATTPLEAALLEAAQKHHNIARGLRNYRDAEGLTTADLATATHLSVGTIERILNGTATLTLERLYALAAAVNATPAVTIRNS